MSTYWGYVCRSHDPEIESDHWFNQGAGALADVYQKERAGEWPNLPGSEAWGGDPSEVSSPDGFYLTRGPIYWLRQHPRCDVALRSEYGDTREIGVTRDARD